MAPDSLGTELLAVGLAVAAAVGLGLLWNRGRGWLRLLLRAGSVLLCVVTATAVAAAWVNRQLDFLPSWSSVNATAAGNVSGVDGPAVANHPGLGASSSGPGHGRVLTVSVPGAASKLTLPMFIYLPPGYDPDAATRYPVIEALHGYPGLPAQWLRALDAPTILDAEIAAGRMAPAVVLFPYQSPNPLRLDTECTNLVGSAQAETFLTQDVPAYAESHLRVRSDQSGWSLIGFSAGAYCATDLLLRHPGQYAAAASLSGYVNPGIRVGDGSEHTTYNVLWRLQHLPIPAVALYLTCAKSDLGAYNATVAIAKAAHNPLSLTTAYITGGGHSGQSWKAMEAPAFDWLSTWLGQPLTVTTSAPPRTSSRAAPAGKPRTGPAFTPR